ncbi:hypothetical protein PG913_02005 [Tenacibaculum pacificus]|uniref:hypothetical protein n=1 Tax=Tenacibaculum pacificus TaxID=3018314 RepID=UPI0022F4037D|nr:hypothetical protein [Tenacibaculum pacificus]WBX74041.1 hypothetical protein PG913_02005 [Tenacibaculum pacificus]
MKRIMMCLAFISLISCENFGGLKVLVNLPKKLEEVSGIEQIKHSKLLWMLNDSGNKAIIYGVNTDGKIIREVAVNAKNNDWEDIASDEKGNLYIADFGNNDNKRKNLKILKINHQDLLEKDIVDVEKIKFSYASQNNFPPKKKKRFFDAESLLYKNGFLYIFTKSRVKNSYGTTTLYKVPAKKGNHIAKRISTFETCNALPCWITASAISSDGKKIALLNSQSVFILTDFNDDDFFSGNIKEFSLGHISQKESVTFKDNNTLYIADEKAHGKGGKLYEFSLK